jgi:hypothetical protein
MTATRVARMPRLNTRARRHSAALRHEGGGPTGKLSHDMTRHAMHI